MGGKRISPDFWANVQVGGPDECWPWLRGSVNKYGHGSLLVNGARKLAHRHAYELTKGPIPEGLFVCHSCDNPPCCNPAHLWVGTNIENAHDRDKKGRTYRPTREELVNLGEKHGGSKLTTADVLAIRQRAEDGETRTSLAIRFNVSRGAIQHIVNRRKWRHI